MVSAGVAATTAVGLSIGGGGGTVASTGRPARYRSMSLRIAAADW